MDDSLRAYERLLAREGIDAIVLEKETLKRLIQEAHFYHGSWLYHWLKARLPLEEVPLTVKCSGYNCSKEQNVYQTSPTGQLTHVSDWLCKDCLEHTSFQELDDNQDELCSRGVHIKGSTQVITDKGETHYVSGCPWCGEIFPEDFTLSPNQVQSGYGIAPSACSGCLEGAVIHTCNQHNTYY